MLNTVRAVVREGRIELLEKVVVPEGTEALVTLLVDDENFWLKVGGETANQIWDNPEDDVYAELLEG